MQGDHAVLVLETDVRRPRMTQRSPAAVVGENNFSWCGHAVGLRCPGCGLSFLHLTPWGICPWGAEIGLQSPQVQAGYRTVAGEKPRGERPVWQDLPLAL